MLSHPAKALLKVFQLFFKSFWRIVLWIELRKKFELEISSQHFLEIGKNNQMVKKFAEQFTQIFSKSVERKGIWQILKQSKT